MRISDWSSDVCSSDLLEQFFFGLGGPNGPLPLHITEYVRERQRNNADSTSKRFLEIGSASCRERVCQYVYISVVAASLKKQPQHSTKIKQLHQLTKTTTKSSSTQYK